MPRVDMSKVTDFDSFVKVYDALVERVATALTDDHKYPDPETGELRAMLHYSDGSRRIGEQPKPDSGYLAFQFLDDGTVEVTESERDVPDAWTSTYSTGRAMAKAISRPISSVAFSYAQKNPGDDLAAVADKEYDRLLRLLDDGWADEIAENGHFKAIKA